MSTVTQRAKQFKQPYGGYVKPSAFTKMAFKDGIALEPTENIHASLVGIAVDYMTRFLMMQDVKKAFNVSTTGYAARLHVLWDDNEDKIIEQIALDGENSVLFLLEQIKGMDDASITAACKAVSYDVWYRDPMAAFLSKDASEITPDQPTIQNIRTMIERSLAFWKNVGPITAEGFDFQEKDAHGAILKTGYTATVNAGEGDYLTSDTLWDFKTSKNAPTSKHTLQLLMYYLMGKHSGIDIFKSITRIGFFNPRLNIAYVLDVKDVPDAILKAVEQDVIGY